MCSDYTDIGELSSDQLEDGKWYVTKQLAASVYRYNLAANDYFAV